MKAPEPENEAERLAALKEYRILDTVAEQLYDDIVILAVNICQVPMALISLVDESRQWFKAKVGVQARQTRREVAFCAHAILHTEPLIVRDATKEERFADSTLVKGAPFIRFYAGYPLVNPEGFALGTLCAIDRKPRRLSAKQDRLMQALARQVMALLELRRTASHLAHALEHVRTLHGLLPICAWCKRIRDDAGYWSQLESYFKTHSQLKFTHGICPQCLDKVRTDLAAQSAGAADSPSPRTLPAK
jgi:GAF domain-containing protein